MQIDGELLHAALHPENEGGFDGALPAARLDLDLDGGGPDEGGRWSVDADALDRCGLGEAELDDGGAALEAALERDALGGGADGVAADDGEGDLGAVGAEEAEVGEIGACGVEGFEREREADGPGAVECDGLPELPGGGVDAGGEGRGGEGGQRGEKAERAHGLDGGLARRKRW